MTRARAMLSRCLGPSGAQDVAAAATLDDALRYLGATAYRHDLGSEAGLADAQRAVSATLLWHLRVLAGWQPRAGAAAIRLLASGFEIANVDDHARALSGAEHSPPARRPYRLGALATAWPRLSLTGSPAELRAVLAGSVWGDPGADSPAAVAIGIRIAAAQRTAAAVPQAMRWAAGRLAPLVGREVFLADRALTPPTARRAALVLGWEAVGAASFDDFLRHLPATARWAVDGIDAPADLWRAETRWWTRLRQDGLELLRGSGLDSSPVVGAVAVLSADAWQVRAALELAARGGGSLEAFDVLA
ncbi:V-type ATPase subunit [Actinacidiphila soli]|uniref:V-type ATPase subunit n=1 Tax=Actinacidiphila soli TaxID=2487275 RepID=UPI001F0BD02B|nr:V-type ATPase subunit [Actinacidiphila soli]